MASLEAVWPRRSSSKIWRDLFYCGKGWNRKKNTHLQMWKYFCHFLWKFFCHYIWLALCNKLISLLLVKLRDKHCLRISKSQIFFRMANFKNNFTIWKWIFFAISTFAIIEKKSHLAIEAKHLSWTRLLLLTKWFEVSGKERPSLGGLVFVLEYLRK